MKLRSSWICKRRAPLRQQSDSHQIIPVTRRRSSRLEAKLRSESILHSLETNCKPENLFEQLPTDPKTSHPVGDILHTHVPTSEVSAPVPSRTQSQEHPRLPQTHNQQTRKRSLSINTDSERPPKRARLTKKNLEAFKKMGRQTRNNPNSKSVRSEPSSSRSQAASKLSKISGSTSKTVPTTDSSFPRLAFENGVLDPVHSTPPENLDCLQDRYDRARDSVSPTESEYKDFAYRIRKAPNEMTVMLETSTLLKGYEQGYRRVYNQAFSDFPKDVGFNNRLSAAQPDMVEGLDMTEFNPFPVRRVLGEAAIPTVELDPPTLPHFAGEWKGPGKDMLLAQTQVAYNGAYMVYGRNTARSFLGSPDPTGHAYVHTFTTDGTTLNTFAHYSSRSEGQVEYHQYPTSTSLLVSSYNDFKKSRQRLRNQEDDAKETSEKLRDELNEKWLANYRSPVPPRVPAEIADPTDGNSYDDEDGEDPNNQLLAEYWAYDSSVQIPAADNEYAPPSASFNNQDESFVHIPSANIVYPPPSASFQENNQDESFMQIPAADDMYAPPYVSFPANSQDDPYMQISTAVNGQTLPEALTFPPITPPQSTEDISLPFESNEGTTHKYSHRRTRRSTRAADPVEGPREGNHNSESRRKRYS